MQVTETATGRQPTSWLACLRTPTLHERMDRERKNGMSCWPGMVTVTVRHGGSCTGRGGEGGEENKGSEDEEGRPVAGHKHAPGMITSRTVSLPTACCLPSRP